MKNNFKKHLKYNFLLLFLLLSKFGFSQEPILMLPIGHTSMVNTATFSPDGKKVVTASADITAKIWDVESGKLIVNLIGHTKSVTCANFSPDGKRIVTGSEDFRKRLWDVESGRLIFELDEGFSGNYKTKVLSVTFSADGKKILVLQEHGIIYVFDVETGSKIDELYEENTGEVSSAAFSPDGKKIVTASDDKTAKIWSAKKRTSEIIANLEGHTGKVNSAIFSPDGMKIVTASDDRTAKIWDVESGKLITDLTGHTESVNSATFSPDGKKIVTASEDKTAKIWDIESGKLTADLTGHRSEVISASFSPNGNKIVTVSYNETPRIWDVETGKLIANLTGHTSRIRTAIFSADGKKIVTASYDKTAKIWNADSGRLIADLKGHTNSLYSVDFSLDGKKLVIRSGGRNAKIWDFENGKLNGSILTGYDHYLNSATFSPDGKKIVTAGDTIAKIWDVESQKLISNLIGHKYVIYSASFSPDGKKIVTSSNDETAKIWDVENGKLITDLKGHTGSVNSASFSSNGKEIVTASDDGTAKIWNAISGKLIANLIGDHELISATFSPNGKTIVATANYGSQIWDVKSGKQISYLGRLSETNSVSFSPDGKRIVIGYRDYAIIWDVKSGEDIIYLKQCNGCTFSAIFSPDGKRIVTASTDGTTQIWNGEEGEEAKLIAELSGHTGSVKATFSPDGKWIVTASQDNTAKIWNSETGALLYTFIAVDQSDYLVYDNKGRYDGTEAARDYLYFTCGTEVIDLTQMKDALYVPGLAQKIMSGQDINYPKLSDLDICDALPLVEKTENTESNYFYKITPRKLGLEYVEVYVNDKKVMNVSKVELREENGLFYLKLKEADVKKHFINEEENKINVVAIAQQNGNELRSRGAIVVSVNEKNKSAVTPKLFAVMIGVNEYKDKALKLNYPVKDANELGNAIEFSAQKLLGKSNVIMYHINSHVKAGNGYTTPEKEGIKRALADIGQKAQPEDLILLFFAGHGVMQSGNEKLFTFLTAEASQSNQIGITTKELQNWLSYDGPNKILANKTILIFDACNSGQATQELMAMARSDDDTRRIRQVEDLKDKSGMFILAASAPNQVAYELPQYEQGLLTYSLLSVLKNNPDILDDSKYLNVQKWFLESEKYLQQLMASLGLKQDSQPFGTANIRIGEVDQEVKQSIQLAVEKPMVICANVLNDATFDDDLGLKMIINTKLSEIAERGVKQSIAYPRKETENVNKINIRYTLKDQTIACEVRLLKSGEILHNTKISGIKSNIDGLVTDIIQEIIKYAK